MTRMAWLCSLLALAFSLGGRLRRPACQVANEPGICRNLNQILCFHDAHGFSEIGFVRRIFAGFSPVPLSSSACFFTPSGQLKCASSRASSGARVDG